MEPSTRRRYVKATALAGLAAAAGCLSGSSGADDGDGTTAVPTTTETDTDTDAPTATCRTDTPTETPATTPPESVSDWLAGANGYDGEARRYGAGSRPTIAVGHGTDDGPAFHPPAVEVPPMTTVRWDWTGHGGDHNVVALDGTFDSGRPNAQSGTGYHYIFEETGVYPYVSEPHRDEGMRGVVFVREPPSTGIPEVDEWVDASNTFEGEVVDRTDADTATVTVGAAGNGGHFAVDPPVLRVSTETTVEWEWSGEGPHTISFEDRDIGTDEVFTDAGVHLRHTFAGPGTYLYACAPHESLGGRGAVLVEEA